MVFAFLIGSPLLIIIVLLLIFGLKVINQYERGLRFTFGKYSGIMQPGLRFVIPIIQSWRRIDIRTKVLDVPNQDAMTKDNVSININAVLYYKVTEPKKAIIEVRDFNYAASQLAQITMKSVVGEESLDTLLSERDSISQKIQQIVDKATDPWGIKVESVDLKHIEIPEDLKRVMAKEAEAEREKRAVIIKAEGEVTASNNISKAATKLMEVPGALHIRTLHSINDLSSDKSQTVIYALPAEVLRALERLGRL